MAPDGWMFEIQNRLRSTCLSLRFSFAHIPHSWETTLPASGGKGRMHSELYRSWVMSSGSNGSVGVVLVRFDLSQETMTMFVIFSTQCSPKPLVASSVSTPQSVPASNCHLPGCLQMSGVSRVLQSLPLLSAVLNGILSHILLL